MSILSVQDLTVSVITGNVPLDITRNISLDIDKGEILGVVGESGCGKSMTALAIMGLLPKTTIEVRSGRILLDDRDITNLEPHQRVDAGLSGVSMIFQEPMTSLNPVMRVGDQIIEALLVHDKGNVRAPAARAKAAALHPQGTPGPLLPPEPARAGLCTLRFDPGRAPRNPRIG